MVTFTTSLNEAPSASTGNLRWKAPQQPASWNGVRDASSFGNVCPQFNFGGQLVGNEDCLTLNVYVHLWVNHTARPVSRELPVDPYCDHRWGYPCCVWSPMRTCRRHYPGRFDEEIAT